MFYKAVHTLDLQGGGGSSDDALPKQPRDDSSDGADGEACVAVALGDDGHP